eukprot:3454078-Prymnesium_polylepis.1
MSAWQRVPAQVSSHRGCPAHSLRAAPVLRANRRSTRHRGRAAARQPILLQTLHSLRGDRNAGRQRLTRWRKSHGMGPRCGQAAAQTRGRGRGVSPTSGRRDPCETMGNGRLRECSCRAKG